MVKSFFPQLGVRGAEARARFTQFARARGTFAVGTWSSLCVSHRGTVNFLPGAPADFSRR